MREQLAADLACEPEQLEAEGVVVVESQPRPARRRFPWRERRVALACLGPGAVISCDAGRIDWARRELAPLGRDALFSARGIARVAQRVEAEGQRLEGPVLKLAGSAERLVPAAAPPGFELCWLGESELIDPPDRAHFPHALRGEPEPLRPARLGVAAVAGRQRVGMAVAEADSEALWQIGVDVRAGERGKGLARALVAALARAVLERGRVPYYSSYPANLASLGVAHAVGLWPAWLELETRPGPAAGASYRCERRDARIR